MTARADPSHGNRSLIASVAHLGVPDSSADALIEGDQDVMSVSLRGQSGAWQRVHSQRNPRAEARRAVDEALAGQGVPPVVVLLGLGLGYIVDEVLERRPDARLLALELAPELLPAFCRRRDWTALLASHQLVIAAAPAFDIDLSRWRDVDESEPPLVIVQPVIARARVQAFAAAHDAWRQAIFERRANAGAKRAFSAIYVRHTLANAARLATEGDISALDGLGAGVPVIICAAGPSLDAVLPDLGRFRHRAIVIAADTALRPLVRAGVAPDLVVAVDPTTMNGRHLVDLPRLPSTYLVAEASVDPRGVNAFAGRTFFARIGRFHPWPWLEEAGVTCGHLQVWGSVLTAACDLAMRLGCGPILLAGTDLAYTDGQPYCRHTTFEGDWAAQAERDEVDLSEVWRRRLRDMQTREPDVHGEPAFTAPHLIAFRNWVRTFVAASPGRTFVNVSGAGILHGDGIGQSSIAGTLGAAVEQVGITGRLMVAHRRGAPAAPTIAAALGTLARTSADDQPLVTWAAEAYDLDIEATRRVVASSASRAAALVRRAARTHQERAAGDMAVTPEWIDVPYDAGNFWAKAPMQWTVPEQAVRTLAYVLDGHTMTLSFTISGATLEGGTTNELYIRIPDDYLPARSVVNAIWIGTSGYREAGYARTHPGLDMLVLFRASEAAYGREVNGLSVFGQITFEVQ